MNMVIDSLETPSVACKVVRDNKQNKMMPYIGKFPNELQQLIFKIVDVQLDGNCGQRTTIALLSQGQESWALIRQDLIWEFQTLHSLYVELYGTKERLIELITPLYLESGLIALIEKWMTIPNISYVIATQYIVVWVDLFCKVGISFYLEVWYHLLHNDDLLLLS